MSETAGQPDGEEPAATADSLGDHLLLLVAVIGGYLLTVVTSAIASVAVPYWLGYRLEWADEATGLFPAEGVVVESVLRVAFASFPIVFAACVVVIDLLVVRVLTTQPRSNRRGLLGWIGLSTTAFALALFPMETVFSAYGIISLMMTPWVGVIIVGLVAVAVGAAGVAGLSIPHALFDGLSLRAASKQTAVALVDDPTALIAPLRSLSAGWAVGMGLFLLGTIVLGWAFGLFVIGAILLPVVLLIWVGAAGGFAAGHVAYRLRTRAFYRNY